MTGYKFRTKGHDLLLKGSRALGNLSRCRYTVSHRIIAQRLSPLCCPTVKVEKGAHKKRTHTKRNKQKTLSKRLSRGSGRRARASPLINLKPIWSCAVACDYEWTWCALTGRVSASSWCMVGKKSSKGRPKIRFWFLPFTAQTTGLVVLPVPRS